MKRWLYIPVEIKVRSYYARLLLACAAAEAGYGVVLGSQRAVVEALPFMNPGLLLEKSISSNKRDFLSKVRAMGHKIAVIDEEGFVYQDADVWAKQRACEETVRLASAILVWGQAQGDIFASHYSESKGKVHRTGHPRVDLLRSGLREFYRDEANELVRSHGEFIFVPSNFALFINANGPQFIRKQYKDFGHTQDSGSEDRLGRNIQFTGDLFFHMLTAIARMSVAFPDRTIVVRPHPGDDHGIWMNLLDPYPNVVVEFQGTIDPYLLAAAVVVHNGCTSAIQAVLMGRPVIAYRPVTSDEFDQKLPNSVSDVAWSLDELMQQIRAVIASDRETASNADAREVLSQHIESLSGDYAYERMLKALHEIDVPASEFHFARLRQFVMKAPRRSMRWLLSQLPCWVRVLEKYERQKFPGLSLSEVQSDVARFAALVGRFEGVKAGQVDRNLFVIQDQGG